MSIRFRKSIKLAPGVRWNISGSGFGLSLGPRGASVSIGRRGTYLNTGIPGTGLYSRTRLESGTARSAPRQVRPANAGVTTSVKMTCGVNEDGTLFFVDSSGNAMPEHLVELAKKQNREAIQGLIQQQCEVVNGRIEALGKLHEEVPDPRVKPKFVAPAFDLEPPPVPRPVTPGWLDKLLGRAKKMTDRYAEAKAAYHRAKAEYDAEQTRFNDALRVQRDFIEVQIYNDIAAMDAHLEATLSDIEWPRETSLSFDIGDAGAKVCIDVDLPEIEDMPAKTASVPSRGLKLSIKEMPASKVQKLYAQHCHGILFRIIGEAFAALPKLQEVVVSGYSQRRSKVDAQVRDEYLLSVRVARSEWQQIDFLHLAVLDPVEALAKFDLRRDMLKSGAFHAIEPLHHSR